MGKGTRIKKELRSHSRAPAPPLDTYARALDALRSGNRAAAIVLLRQVVLAYPRHAQAHFNLATALREQADLQTAIVHYKEALAIEPASVDAMVNLGETLRRSLKTADALTWCDRAVAAAPRHSEAYLIRGVVRHDLGDLPAAVADLRKSIAEAPQVVTGYRMLGQILSRTPRKQEALDILRRGSALAPEDVEFHRLIGDVCDQMGLLGEGFEAYRRAINLDPRDPSTYANFTGLLCKTKLLDVALNVSAIGIALANGSRRHGNPTAKPCDATPLRVALSSRSAGCVARYATGPASPRPRPSRECSHTEKMSPRRRSPSCPTPRRSPKSSPATNFGRARSIGAPRR
jgi:tetratricopeptide (TPR) repeat protein